MTYPIEHDKVALFLYYLLEEVPVGTVLDCSTKARRTGGTCRADANSSLANLAKSVAKDLK